METNDKQPSNNNTETVKFSLNFKKQNHAVEFGLNQSLSELRQHIALITGVAPGLQKLMFKGMLKEDEKTLKELNFKDSCKLMLIGSTINDVMATAAPPVEKKEKEEEEAQKESLSDKMPHKKIVEKGPPEDAVPGKQGKHEPLPNASITGIYNNIGVKVRLTFKMWSQELWIQSASSTQKLPFSTIRAVTSEPINGRDEYHIVTLQLGASDKSKYYLYFVPCQYVRGIKAALTGDYLGGL